MSDGKNTILTFSRSEGGHRRSYIDFVGTLFQARRVGAKRLLWSREPVFFLMIEESFGFFVLLGFWRALLGRRTVGLLFRPGPAVHGAGMRHRIKRTVLKLMKHVGSIKVLTIVPFTIAAEFATIADDWIYDLQLWDLSETGKTDLLPQPEGAVASEIVALAKGRPVICALGIQDQNKGFDVFARTWSQSAELRDRYFFAYGGTVTPVLRDLADALAAKGCMGLNRQISDAELFQIYSVSSAAWCLYDKAYDQASGILGRAIQFGLPAIVREGSLSHRLCVETGAPHIAATAETVEAKLAEGLPERDATRGAALAKHFRAVSAQKLAAALGAELQA